MMNLPSSYFGPAVLRMKSDLDVLKRVIDILTGIKSKRYKT